MKTPNFSAIRSAPFELDSLPLPAGDLWVFGYGSLMWNPGFDVRQAVPARLYGYHRRLCLWSIHYRGTAKRPGLVLGLARGGSCNGIALRVARRHTPAASAYLLKREMVNNAYRPAIKKVYLRRGDGDGDGDDGGGGDDSVDALTFISKPEHPQFAQSLSIADTVAVVLQARGEGGKNCDYVVNTARHLSHLAIECAEIHRVAERLHTTTGASA